jgi:cation:H+ antiporter
MEFVLIIAGLVLLVFGGDYLVKGASGIALKFNMPSMLVGMTVVALGTSSPELVVSVRAALAGKPDISTGNVVGSNIANVCLILGITTIIFPVAIKKSVLKNDWVAMMVASVLFYFLVLNGQLSRWEGILFVSLLGSYITYSFIMANKAAKEAMPEEFETGKAKGIWILVLYVVLGTVGLVYGAKWFLEGAEAIARNLGVSDRVIAITLVAFGTSVPELAASIIAALKKEHDIFLGNIIGSNLFNILAILGITSIISPIEVADEIIQSDMFWMLATSFVLLPMGLLGKRLSRLDGSILFGTYLVYVYILLFSPW